ncbi:GNAT superfamily N-acetyltransferase [Povalibacter uvarum]|uniref:GNAT superfamily N-acetyltransferase n=1 Tax=Povalibacter uvarum TaxID=732238 RepID=A0A841HTJ1_9GAMM|nr:GNAT family N-acetyltransferase [Povalibacter uvarum]MBB6096216.1 GNAT superfamily N-acetyltransferase [Povalibacter uvarum]
MTPRDVNTLPSPAIRPSRSDEIDIMTGIINAAAEAYRGVIPPDRWHEPYMPEAELLSEIEAGVRFVCCEIDDAVVGVMGIQTVRNVDLIRHAYTLPGYQGRGVGSALIAHLRERTERPVLVGTWAAATWAVRFYERHGFRLVPEDLKPLLLRTYWRIPERQIETSVVLTTPQLSREDGVRLVENSQQRG